MKFLTPVFAASLTLSAFLLFGMQPLFGKMLLPLLGGTPAVWNTAMVFFQALLLGGYAYAHALAKIPRLLPQIVIHLALLLLAALSLPIAIPAGWPQPGAGVDPAFWQLRLMLRAVGPPFFVLSASAPLLQSWFARSRDPQAHNPYFLYAASNVGSFAALLLYPILFEPLASLRQQAAGWSAGYALLALAVGGCGGLALKFRSADEAAEEKAAAAPLRARQVGLWFLLAFVPSSLMLGVTTLITTDLASAPLLWIVPLALYVATFVLAFARRPPFAMKTLLMAQAAALAAATVCLLLGGQDFKIAAALVHLAAFALTALVCHRQLAAREPPAARLTLFYLTMSAGGVAGGIFNALIAPRVFAMPVEYALVIGLAVWLRWRASEAKAGHDAIFAAVVSVLLLLHPGYAWSSKLQALEWRRNFFGVLRVFDEPAADVRIFTHGTTVHGAQPLDAAHRLTPIAYYYAGSLTGDIFGLLNDGAAKQQHIAGLGLGVGSIACYARPGRGFDFYEIDPDVAAIAQDRRLFTYLSGCGSPYRIVIGDARLNIVAAPDHSYDLIFVDTFSSDNIPVHLITREALALYFRKLKPGGIVAINLSNRHLTLEPVIAADARDLGLAALFKSKRGGLLPGTNIPYTGSIFAVLAQDPARLAPLQGKRWHPWALRPDQKAWRDDFSNIVGAIRWKAPVPDE